MLHAGLDLSRRRLDVCLLSDHGELVEQIATLPDVDGLRGLVGRVRCQRQPVRAVIESMNGARFVHDTLDELGWEVLVADAQKVKRRAPLACKTDKIDARVLAVLWQRDLVPAIWLPDPSIRRERELARFRLHLVRHRTTLKNRIHATLIAFGHPCPVSDLFGYAGRELLDRLAIPGQRLVAGADRVLVGGRDVRQTQSPEGHLRPVPHLGQVCERVAQAITVELAVGERLEVIRAAGPLGELHEIARRNRGDEAKHASAVDVVRSAR